MGLFSFLKNVGAKIFSGKASEPKETSAMDETARQILNEQRELSLRAEVANHKLNVDNLDIRVNGDQVVVYGQAASQADKEKTVLVIGNTNGIASVDDQMTVEVQEPESTFYEVKKGDSLSLIAKAYYGDPMKFRIIFNANTPMLKDPNLIYPGQVLRIPNDVA